VNGAYPCLEASGYQSWFGQIQAAAPTWHEYLCSRMSGGLGLDGDTIDQEDIIQRDGDDLSLQREDSREGHAE
jgi:hypothetical protein